MLLKAKKYLFGKLPLRGRESFPKGSIHEGISPIQDFV